MYEFSHKSYLLGTITVQFDKDPSHNIECICSRVLIRSKFCKDKKKGTLTAYTDEDFTSLCNDRKRFLQDDITVSNTYSPSNLKTDSLDDPLMSNAENEEPSHYQNIDANLDEQHGSCCCGLCCCFESTFQYFKKKVFGRKRREVKNVNDCSVEPSEPKAMTDSNNQISTSHTFCNSSSRSSKSDDTLKVSPQPFADDCRAAQGVANICVGDPVQNGLLHMGFAFKASRSDNNTLYKRVILNYNEQKIERWNEPLVLQNKIEEASSSEGDVIPTNPSESSTLPDSKWNTSNHLYPTDTVSLLTSLRENSDQLQCQNTNECLISLTTKMTGVCKRNKNSKKKNKKKRTLNNTTQSADIVESLLPEIFMNKKLLKYWRNRYNLFSLFDQGIRLDDESWFSVTPEKISRHTAERCRCDVIIDGFCGAGGNTIQFAFTCERVIAIDIDPQKIKLARHNAEVYGVADRIDFIVGDFFEVAPGLQADVVFLSPPWGGPDYNKRPSFRMNEIMPPYGGKRIFEIAKEITQDVAYFLPRNINMDDILNLLTQGEKVETEQNILGSRLVSITAYFGELVNEDLEVTRLKKIVK